MARALNDSRATMPWDIHPALTADRLAVCARLLASARRDAFAMASYELGDDPWSVGCRAYSFGRRRLARAAQSGQHNWLGILDDTHHFVFLIEDVPVRFYRGPAEEPSNRTLRRAQDEANQLTLALGEDAAAGLIFRLAIETASSGEVQRAVFLALRGEEGMAECFWPVPLTHPRDPATTVEPAQLGLLPEDGTQPVLGGSPGWRRASRAGSLEGRERRAKATSTRKGTAT